MLLTAGRCNGHLSQVLAHGFSRASIAPCVRAKSIQLWRHHSIRRLGVSALHLRSFVVFRDVVKSSFVSIRTICCRARGRLGRRRLHGGRNGAHSLSVSCLVRMKTELFKDLDSGGMHNKISLFQGLMYQSSVFLQKKSEMVQRRSG